MLRIQNRRLTIAGFLGPAVLSLVIVGITPLAFAVYTSFYRYQLTNLRNTSFIGFDNYLFVLTDESFWEAMGRTFTLLLISLPIQIALGIGIALLLHSPGLTLLRTIAQIGRASCRERV